jgi:hypothetical protein
LSWYALMALSRSATTRLKSEAAVERSERSSATALTESRACFKIEIIPRNSCLSMSAPSAPNIASQTPSRERASSPSNFKLRRYLPHRPADLAAVIDARSPRLGAICDLGRQFRRCQLRWRSRTHPFRMRCFDKIQKLTPQRWTLNLLCRVSLPLKPSDKFCDPARPAGPRKFERPFHDSRSVAHARLGSRK